MDPFGNITPSPHDQPAPMPCVLAPVCRAAGPHPGPRTPNVCRAAGLHPQSRTPQHLEGSRPHPGPRPPQHRALLGGAALWPQVPVALPSVCDIAGALATFLPGQPPTCHPLYVYLSVCHMHYFPTHSSAPRDQDTHTHTHTCVCLSPTSWTPAFSVHLLFVE